MARKLRIGYIRASANPEALRAIGVNWSEKDIEKFLHPKDSGFRAEIYLPDPAILGKEAKPVLVFKGTDSEKGEDWLNNARQGSGMQSDYYDRAMELGLALKSEFKNDATQFEIAGHSLGGGLASAASAVTGAQATTFNSSGLHPDTAPRFVQGGPLFNTDNTVKAYQVKGEVLTSVQNGIDNMSDFRRAQLGFLAETASDLSRNPGLKEPVSKLIESYVIRPDKDASPEEKKAIQDRARTLGGDAKELIDHLASTNGNALLKKVPTAAGELMPMLEAKMVDKNGQFFDKPKALPLGDLGELAGPIANALSVTAAAAKSGQQLGAQVHAAGQRVDTALDKSGDVHQATLTASGHVTKQAINEGGEQVGKFVRVTGSAAAGTRQGAGELEARFHEGQGKIQGDVYDMSTFVFRKVGLDGLAERSAGWAKDARLENQQEAAQARASANADARQLRHAGNNVAGAIEARSSAVGEYTQQQQAALGKRINTTMDDAGNTVRNVSSYAPAAGVLAATAVSAPLANAVLNNPLEQHKNHLVAFFALNSAKHAMDRHSMTETVRPSLDFKIEQREREILKHPLMQTEARDQQKSQAPSMPTGKAKLTPEDPSHQDYSHHEKIRIGIQKLGFEGAAANNVSAALLLSVKQEGSIHRIDDVYFNKTSASNSEGSRVFATYRPHGDKTPFFHADVNVAEAAQKPAEKTFTQIESFNQQQAQQQALVQQQQQQQQQNQDKGGRNV